jgi:hypothetical protein
MFARHRLGFSISAAFTVCLLVNSCWRLAPQLRGPATAPDLGSASTNSAHSAAARSRGTLRSYGELPQRFEANRGQTDSRFISRGKGFAIFFKETEAVIRLRSADRESGTDSHDGPLPIFHPQSSIHNPHLSGLDLRSTTLRMRLVNANSSPRIEGLDEQPGRSNYFIGGDSRRWITGVPAYSKVRYEQVWQGLAAAVVLRVKADGSQVYGPAARFDAAQNKFVAVPIDLGDESDQVFLLLFGMGLRHIDSPASVTARIGGAAAEVSYAGAQGGFVGLDQVNLRAPRGLIGRGDVDITLTVNGKTANNVGVSIK